MPSVVLVRKGRHGAVIRDALVQEGIGFVEIRPEDLGELGAGLYRNARVLILPAPLGEAALAQLSPWRARGGATLLLGSDWPAEVLLELLGVRELPHRVSGGHLWASSPGFVLPATAPDRPLQITGERPLYAVQADDAKALALASTHPSAVVTLDANRDGFIDDEWYFIGPSISRLSRGRAVVEPLALPALGSFAPQAAAAGDFTGDGFADDLLVASGDTFALLHGGVWSEPQRAPGAIRHALSHPTSPGALWAVHLFLGDGSTYVSSFDGGRSFGPPSRFAPEGVPLPSEFSYSFDFSDPQGSRCTGIHVWSGGACYANLGSGFVPLPAIADLGPRYLNANVVRPGLGFASDADRSGLRDRITLMVGDNLYRLDPATGSYDYPRALHRTLDVPKAPLVVRRGRTIGFLFDFEETVKHLQQGRPDRVAKEVRSDPAAGPGPQPGGLIAPVISAFDDWVDYTAWDLPQADLHERLLRQAILDLLDAPLPRLWYWPGAARSIASLSHDVEVAQGEQREAARSCTLDMARRSAEVGRKSTFFVLDTPPEESVLQKEDIAAIEQLGHRAALHFNAFRPTGFAPSNLQAQATELRALGVEKVTGNRTHGLAWVGDLLPRALASEPAISYDSTLGGGPGFSHCGSVLPYRIYDEGGEAFPSFEEISHGLMDVADSSMYFSGLAPPGVLTMSVDDLFARARLLAERNDEAFHGVLDCLFHPSVVAGLVPSIGPFLDAFAAHAGFLAKKGIPSMTLEQVATWWRLRRGLRIVDVTIPSAFDLDFAIEASEPIASPTILLPVQWTGRTLASISSAGNALGWTAQMIDGIQMAMVVLPAASGRTELSARYQQ